MTFEYLFHRAKYIRISNYLSIISFVYLLRSISHRCRHSEQTLKFKLILHLKTLINNFYLCELFRAIFWHWHFLNNFRFPSKFTHLHKVLARAGRKWSAYQLAISVTHICYLYITSELELIDFIANLNHIEE